MCGRFGVSNLDLIYNHFDVSPDIRKILPHYNIAPSQFVPVITRNGKNKIEIMKWGLIPFWAKDIRIGNKMINARAEGIEDKPSFRKPIRFQRCIVPASYFFEWGLLDKEKVPYLFRLKNAEIFSIAGLYDVVKDAEGKDLKSFTIITTEPNEIVERIHNRMPVILSADDEEKWLNPDETDVKNILPLLKPYPANEMEYYRVSNLVNSPDFNNPEVLNKFSG